MKKLAIIVDSTIVSKHIYDVIHDIKKSSVLDLDILIIQDIKQKYLLLNLSSLLKNLLFRLVFNFEKYILFKRFTGKSHLPYFKKYDISKFFNDQIIINPIISKKGNIFRFNQKDVEKITSLSLDLIIRGGSGIYKGDILNAASEGVISFHHGDNEIFRGGPYGFWEVYFKKPYTGFIIQILNNRLDGGLVLFKSFIETESLYVLNSIKIINYSSTFLSEVIENYLYKKSSINDSPKWPYDSIIYKSPDITSTIIYSVRLVKLLIVIVAKKIFNLSEKWSVHYVFTEDWKNSVLYKSTVIENPKYSFLADPFPFYFNNSHYIFMEEFSYINNKGKIVVYKVTGKNHERMGVALEENFHLSFPFIFCEQDNIYMIPESHQARGIRLYKCRNFPLDWELQEVLLSNMEAVDTIMLKFSEIWYMMTNVRTNKYSDFSTNLEIFSSKTLLNGTWKKIKNTSASKLYNLRNGGLIIDKDKIYRISQNNKFNHYGYSININLINDLGSSSYNEQHKAKLIPNFDKESIGIHSLNYSHSLLVFDSMKISKKK